MDETGELKRALGGVVFLEETLLKNGKDILELSSLIIEKLSLKLNKSLREKS